MFNDFFFFIIQLLFGIRVYLKHITHISKIKYIMKLIGRRQKYCKNLIMKVDRQLYNEICQFYYRIVELIYWIF